MYDECGRGLEAVKSGDRVVVGHACGEPPLWWRPWSPARRSLKGWRWSSGGHGADQVRPAGNGGKFRHNSLFVGASTRKAVSEGRALHTPCFFSEIPRFFSCRILPVDVTLMQVTPPDDEGFAALACPLTTRWPLRVRIA